MANNNIKALKEISKIDSAIAGGKGASLGELLKIGILVPDGFIILSNVFDNFLKKTELYSTINKTLKELDFKKSSTIKTASNKIKKLILSKEIPNEIKNEILVNFKNLRSDFVAIRSSATTEDSISAAWAGQLNSYLNTTEETILENIKECWASLFNERAIHYRFENKLINKKISVAVVVQKMIQAEKSGVAFSVHPVTQNNNQIIIEAGFGLGEAIVSGEITPDSYIIDKTSYKITDIKANKKVKALYKKSKGGDIWKKLKEKSNQQVLTKNEITKLSKIVVQIEKHYGFPCDIEWAKEKNNFYITQSRPITTLSNTKDVQEYYKIMTRPLSLVDCECWDIGERIKLPQKFHNLLFFDPLFICTPKKAVAVYYNFTDPKQNPQPLIDYLEKNLDWFKNEKTSFDKNCNEIRALIINKSRDLKKLLLLNHEIWPMIAIANVLGSTELLKISKKLRGICIKIRKESDDVLHPSLTYINSFSQKVIH
jgi:phosphoenolpyruvate synthase/pyruvate phosphate dikinase